jgi:hypothetical protein
VLRKKNARLLPGAFQVSIRRRSTPGVRLYDVVGAGFKWRYMIYALIDPVLANNFQKISEVRICRRYPFSNVPSVKVSTEWTTCSTLIPASIASPE